MPVCGTPDASGVAAGVRDEGTGAFSAGKACSVRVLRIRLTGADLGGQSGLERVDIAIRPVLRTRYSLLYDEGHQMPI